MVCWQRQWWTDVTALLCLAVTLRHQPCHTQSHGKCHDTSLRVTHRFRSFAERESFENIQPCCFYISDDIYKCKQLNETVHSKIHCRCIRYSLAWASFWSMTMLCIFPNKTSTMKAARNVSKVNKNENVRIPNIMVNDKWQWYIESMKKIPKRIINDPPKGWMRPIEMFWELIRFQNTNIFFSIYINEVF